MLLLSVPLSEHAEPEVPDRFPVDESGNESPDEIPMGRPGKFLLSSSKVRLFRINRQNDNASLAVKRFVMSSVVIRSRSGANKGQAGVRCCRPFAHIICR